MHRSSIHAVEAVAENLARTAHDIVHSDPAGAVAVSERVLDDPAASAVERCRALWARGLAKREMRDLRGAEDDLSAAYEAAVVLGEWSIASRVAITRALTTLHLGRTDDALALLDAAERNASGADRAHLLLQRALVHHRLGDLDQALTGYHGALDLLVVDEDAVAIARVHANLSVLHAHRFEVDAAGHHGVLAIRLADELGQEMLAAGSEHNLGYAFARAGDLAAALDLMASAEARFERMADSGAQLAIMQADRADVLLKAHLLDDARDEADRALAAMEADGNVTDTADISLLAARARLAAGDLDGARAAARRAAALFERHGRSAQLPLAEFVEVQADDAEGLVDGLAERAESVARGLARARWGSEAMSARVVAGSLYLARGDHDKARRVLGRASAARGTGPAGDRAAAYLATALLHEATGERSAARRSVNLGLRTLFDNQATLGALELRSHAIAHGHGLAEVGARLAVADSRPREMLARIEAARGMISLLPRASAPRDEQLAELLAELRQVTETQRDATAGGEARPELQQRRVELEDRIRRNRRRARADGEVTDLGLGEAIATLGDRALVEYGDLHGELWAVTVVGGRCRLHELGALDEIEPAIDQIDFALNRLNRIQGSSASRAAARATIRTVGGQLGRRLLPDRVRSSERPLVVVPTGRLHGLAWGALPSLADRPVSVAPSLFGHTVAIRAGTVRRRRHTALIGGPGLPAARAELDALMAIYPHATVLDGGRSTASSCIAALSRATLAHVACHGSFRSDNPLFSTLRVADGDLTVYDLERCERLPRTMVLSACNAAVSSVLRGGALLGMSSSLIQLGVSSVIAPLTPVSDERSVSLMIRLHRELDAGAPPALALARAAGVDGELDPTAAAFVALGA